MIRSGKEKSLPKKISKIGNTSEKLTRLDIEKSG